MLKEFVDTIGEMAVKGAGPQITEHDPYSPFAHFNMNGDIEVSEGLPKPRSHAARDLTAICEFAKRFADKAVIWYSREKVVAVIDDTTRRDTVTLAMMFSDEILKLQELQRTKPWFDHRSLLTLLRTVFTPAALPMNQTLINDIRVVKFEASQSGSSEIGRGKSSAGKAAIAAVEGWDKLPEFLSLSVPVFGNAFIRERVTVACALEINEQEQRFQLFPLPGAIEEAVANAEGDLGAEIRESVGEVPVYYGNP